MPYCNGRPFSAIRKKSVCACEFSSIKTEVRLQVVKKMFEFDMFGLPHRVIWFWGEQNDLREEKAEEGVRIG